MSSVILFRLHCAPRCCDDVCGPTSRVRPTGWKVLTALWRAQCLPGTINVNIQRRTIDKCHFALRTATHVNSPLCRGADESCRPVE